MFFNVFEKEKKYMDMAKGNLNSRQMINKIIRGAFIIYIYVMTWWN